MQQISSTARTTTRSTAFRALAPVFFYFVVAGVGTVMLGPLLPALTQHWHIQDAQAGTLFTAAFAGQLCGSWIGVRNVRASILYGAFITAVGCAAMAWVGFGAAHVALFCMGAGLGAGLTAGNVIAGTAVPSARVRLIAILNVAWSVGAITCPILVRACGPSGSITFFYLTSSAFVIAAVFAIIIPHKIDQPDAIAAEARLTPQERRAKLRIPLPLPALLMFAAAMFLYVGVENALGGWLPSYAIRINPSAHAASIALYFWIAQLAGRLLMSAPKNLLGEASLYRISVASLILTEALLLATRHLAPNSMTALAILSGLTLAPIYPLILSFMIARTGSHPRLGPLFSAASFGGATLPWITGIVSTQFHNLRIGLFVPAIGAVLLLLLSTGISTTSPTKTAT